MKTSAKILITAAAAVSIAVFAAKKPLAEPTSRKPHTEFAMQDTTEKDSSQGKQKVTKVACTLLEDGWLAMDGTLRGESIMRQSKISGPFKDAAGKDLDFYKDLEVRLALLDKRTFLVFTDGGKRVAIIEIKDVGLDPFVPVDLSSKTAGQIQ